MSGHDNRHDATESFETTTLPGADETAGREPPEPPDPPPILPSGEPDDTPGGGPTGEP